MDTWHTDQVVYLSGNQFNPVKTLSLRSWKGNKVLSPNSIRILVLQSLAQVIVKGSNVLDDALHILLVIAFFPNDLIRLPSMENERFYFTDETFFNQLRSG